MDQHAAHPLEPPCLPGCSREIPGIGACYGHPGDSPAVLMSDFTCFIVLCIVSTTRIDEWCTQDAESSTLYSLIHT
jgi:hypothetical protein